MIWRRDGCFPPDGWIKVNFDDSFVEQTGEAGVGVITRNSKGEVIFIAWRALSRCANAPEAEAFACLEGIQLAGQWVQGPVLFEMGCARVHNAMTNNDNRSEIGLIIREAKEHTQVLVNWRVVQAKRECNSVAHNLAHLARRSAETAF
jgi:ribonuclease HI